MYIVCACDQEYLPHTATMLCSVLSHTDTVQGVYLLHDGISAYELGKLKEFVSSFDVEITDCKVDSSGLENLPVSGHASLVNYYRLLIADLLPSSIDRVIYLDSDLIAISSLEPLWATELAGNTVGAVENPGFVQHSRLGIPQVSKYFNSGVLLIDLDQWRRLDVRSQVIAYIEQNPDKIKLWDQDGLNAVLYDRWQELPMRWNIQRPLFFDECYKLQYADVLRDPAVVHFSGSTKSKPWQYGTTHPYCRKYSEYRSKTPWNKYKLEGQLTLAQRAFRKIRGMVHRSLVQFFVDKSENSLVKKLTRAVELANRERERKYQLWRKEEAKALITQIQPTLEVMAGPFEGLKYSQLESVGSALSPKILGSYEAELHPIIYRILQINYTTILDIGCAEGYYAVGLAMKKKDASVYAFDTDPKARSLCEEMSFLNGTSDRLSVLEFFSMESVRDLAQGERGLLISDCEGYERLLFHKQSKHWNYLSHYDLLIEIHEFMEEGVSEYIYNLFKETHDIEVISSVDDLLRPIRFNCPISQNIEIKRMLMAERRPCGMEWFFMSAKSQKRNNQSRENTEKQAAYYAA
ncbi:MAG: glycosyltransferase [Cyanobacteria bacterium J06581_3]